VLTNLDHHLLRQLYRESVPDISTLRADKLIVLGPVTKQDLFTVAGVVLLHTHPRNVFPAAEVLFAIFRGKITDEIIRTVDISAPLTTTTYQILDIIEPLTAIETQRSGPRVRPSKFSNPPIAIRETLLNALVHRRYSANAPIKVALFEDRLEIFSPGNFPGPINLEELGSGVSYYRNPTIANFARRLGLVERRG
jgi:ATP-dependent DNA helicase RecG